MRKVILSKKLVEAAQAAEREWFARAPRFSEEFELNSFEAMKVALETAIPLYLETDEPGLWQYGINYRDIVGGPFNRYDWFDSKEAAASELDVLTSDRGQFRDKGDGHGVSARPCRRWIGRPFWEDTFDELDEWDSVPQASFTLHDATPEQAEEIFHAVCDHIYEVAENISDSKVSVTGSLMMGGVPKGRLVKDPSEVPLPGPGE